MWKFPLWTNFNETRYNAKYFICGNKTHRHTYILLTYDNAYIMEADKKYISIWAFISIRHTQFPAECSPLSACLLSITNFLSAYESPYLGPTLIPCHYLCENGKRGYFWRALFISRNQFCCWFRNKKLPNWCDDCWKQQLVTWISLNIYFINVSLECLLPCMMNNWNYDNSVTFMPRPII